MNIEEAIERFNLSEAEAKRIEEYFKKAEFAKVLYCEDHDREYYDFEFCPGCKQEEMDS